MSNPTITNDVVMDNLVDESITVRTRLMDMGTEGWDVPEDATILTIRDVVVEWKLFDKLPTEFSYEGEDFAAPYDLSYFEIPSDGVVATLRGKLYETHFRPFILEDAAITADEIVFLNHIRDSLKLTDKVFLIETAWMLSSITNPYDEGSLLRPVRDLFNDPTFLAINEDLNDADLSEDLSWVTDHSFETINHRAWFREHRNNEIAELYPEFDR